MQVRVLGEVEVDAEAPIALGGPIQRRMLAALAIRRGEVVSVPWLADVVWPDGSGPARAEHNIRTYVHRLRAALGDDGVRIETVGAGYRLRLNVEELDAAQFEWLADAAASAADSGDRSVRSSTSVEPSGCGWAPRWRSSSTNLGQRRPSSACANGAPIFVSVERRR